MSGPIAPLPLLLMMFSGWVNHSQVDVIEYFGRVMPTMPAVDAA